MGILDTIKSGIQDHFDKKKEEREMMERLQREARASQILLFEEQFKKNALEVAKAKAHQDAAKLSGLQKLRATNRASRLTETGGNPGSWFSKLSEHTQKNLAQREENLKRTKEMRETAKKMREDSMAKRIKERQERMGNRKW